MKTLKTLSLILLLTALNTHAFVEERDSSVVTQEEIEISEALYNQGRNIVVDSLDPESNALEQLVLQYLAFAARLGHPTAQDEIDVIISTYPPQLRAALQEENQNITEQLASVQAITNSSTVEMEVAESLYNKGHDLRIKSLNKTINTIRFRSFRFRPFFIISRPRPLVCTICFSVGVEFISAAAQLGHPAAQDAVDSSLNNDSWLIK